MDRLFAKIKTFFKEVRTEAKKVDWPSRQQTFRYTLIVIGISAAVTAFLGVLDFIYMALIGRFIL